MARWWIKAAVRQLSLARSLFARLGPNPSSSGPTWNWRASRIAIRTGLGPLTSRQIEVARAIADGKTNRQIAQDLCVSIKTVEFHVNQILTRLGVDSRTEVVTALRAG